jgi:hypothetical protein
MFYIIYNIPSYDIIFYGDSNSMLSQVGVGSKPFPAFPKRWNGYTPKKIIFQYFSVVNQTTVRDFTISIVGITHHQHIQWKNTNLREKKTCHHQHSGDNSPRQTGGAFSTGPMPLCIGAKKCLGRSISTSSPPFAMPTWFALESEDA